MESFLDFHASEVPVKNSGSSKHRTEFLEGPFVNGQNHHHDDASNRDVGETVGGLCKSFPCTFHRILYDLGYRVIKCLVKDLQHSKSPVPSVWCSQVSTNTAKLSFVLQEKSIPNPARAIAASAILK